MKPEIPPEKMAEYEKSRVEYCSQNSLFSHLPPDVWHSGCWLNERLKEMGMEDAEVDAVCFTHGRMCFGNDPWEAAVKWLASVKAKYLPPAEKAARIRTVLEKFGRFAGE